MKLQQSGFLHKCMILKVRGGCKINTGERYFQLPGTADYAFYLTFMQDI